MPCSRGSFTSSPLPSLHISILARGWLLIRSFLDCVQIWSYNLVLLITTLKRGQYTKAAIKCLHSVTFPVEIDYPLEVFKTCKAISAYIIEDIPNICASAHALLLNYKERERESIWLILIRIITTVQWRKFWRFSSNSNSSYSDFIKHLTWNHL